MCVFKKIIVVICVLLIFIAFIPPKSTRYKCMIQMENYEGEGAYVVISLINPKGEYEKTLQVLGNDAKWFHEILFWWDYYEQKFSEVDGVSGETSTNGDIYKNWDTESIDAITGATITSGKRVIKIIEIENDKVNTGYKIRFETAVEDKEYYSDDVEFELTSKSVREKTKGKGFIRYVRMIPQ